MARRIASLLILTMAGLGLPTAARAQVTGVHLIDRGRPVPVQVTPDIARLGRTITHGLLAAARRDVTRPVSDGELRALGERGTLLRVQLAAAEDVVLLRLGRRARASRLAAYVPPDRDDHAFIFLGRSRWDRIVVVDLPGAVRDELRRLRSESTPAR